eukprot:TRINITY_DN31752_c0_g1_i1.p1 TRINITY_DN31752_c0_g1~~TRINITY_DN31752_c0_g1_i1.p1  ORF type:complete len:274 (+),score=47.12 TRINITY_DN31752_c0_g1_i1:160-981(+)
MAAVMLASRPNDGVQSHTTPCSRYAGLSRAGSGYGASLVSPTEMAKPRSPLFGRPGSRPLSRAGLAVLEAAKPSDTTAVDKLEAAQPALLRAATCSLSASSRRDRPTYSRSKTLNTGTYGSQPVIAWRGGLPPAAVAASRPVATPLATLRPRSPLKPASPLVVKPAPQPKLLLPLPARISDAAPTGQQEVLPQWVAAPPSLPARKQVQSRGGRAMPPRLQALDDQTTLPREVYNRMLQAGQQARGVLGYGQHMLKFRETGEPVLRHRTLVISS